MSYLETLHGRIIHNGQWLEWSRMIEQFSCEQDIKFGCNHSAKHWLFVARNSEEFCRRVGADKHTIALAHVAGLLHDCGLICGDKNHAENGAQIARAFLHGDSIVASLLDDSDIDVICHAIAQHSTGDSIRNIVDASVMFADKIHITKDRVVKNDNPILNEVTKIYGVNYTITAQTLTIQYQTLNDFNPGTLFIWDKVYRMPAKVAEFLGKKLVFIVNGTEISLPNT